MKFKKEKFVFEISVDAVPHTKETAEAIFGKDSFNSDYGVETNASELISTVLQDSFIHSQMTLMKHLAKCKCEPDVMNDADRRYYNYLQRKVDVAEAVWKSYKFVRVEKNT